MCCLAITSQYTIVLSHHVEFTLNAHSSEISFAVKPGASGAGKAALCNFVFLFSKKHFRSVICYAKSNTIDAKMIEMLCFENNSVLPIIRKSLKLYFDRWIANTTTNNVHMFRKDKLIVFRFLIKTCGSEFKAIVEWKWYSTGLALLCPPVTRTSLSLPGNPAAVPVWV